MTEQESETYKYNPFDVTKEWLLKDFPLLPVGRLVLNKNPSNYFAEVEQIGFDPGHMIPGVEPSPDKLLQGRLFSYHDTLRHRLGTNFFQIPINCPFRVRNYQRDGPQTVNDNQAGAPNYFPNSFGGPMTDPTYLEPTIKIDGDAKRYDTSDDDNFSQVGIYWRENMDDAERDRTAKNIASHLVNAVDFLRFRAIENFKKCDPEYGNRIKFHLDSLL